MMDIKVITLSSLAKVYEDKIYGEPIDKISTAKNKEIDIQLALLGTGEYSFEINTTLEGVSAHRVGLVPVEMPTYESCMDDPNYQRLEKGLFPDPLFPITDGKITLEKGKYASMWLQIPPQGRAGEHSLEVKFYQNGALCASASAGVRVYNVELPEKELKFTQWFHNDCIASVHGVEVFSEEHWALIEKYISLASSHGMNMLLTPVLTPPLDTEVGGERPTVQLVDITKTENGYEFDTSRLKRYVNIATGCGIKYFEINHFFTQWGAEHAPKVVAKIDGEEKKIFGWETDALSSEYVEFLGALVPVIIDTLNGLGISKDRIFFHISDEPSEAQLEQYSKVSAILTPLIEGCNQIDALSKIQFYHAGVVKTPVVGTSDLEPFFEDGVKDLWCYYCCAQARDVANRFMAMPSERNRIIGVQMYLHDIVGFLHWGYNFYYTQFSKCKELDPYKETQAGGAFPSGDSFSVYPYGDGVIPSLRLKVFRDALDDIRLLSLAKSRLGGEAVREIVRRLAKMDITFKKYPLDESFFHLLTKELYERLEN